MLRAVSKLGTLVRALRPYAERVPGLATAYRDLRERLPLYTRPVETPLGFQFAGYANMARGIFEPDETRFLSDELADADTFVDVGANIGYFTCLARARGVHTIAIEPLESNLRLLYRNVVVNGWRDRVEVFPVALSRTPGLLELFGTNTGASLIPGWSGRSASNARVVAVSTLDTVLGTHLDGRRLLIKVDVEGVEHDVLAGATATLAHDPAPRWLVEVCLSEHRPTVNPHFREVFEAFWHQGYHAEALEARRPIEPSDVDAWIATGQRAFGTHNVIFVKDRKGR